MIPGDGQYKQPLTEPSVPRMELVSPNAQHLAHRLKMAQLQC